MVRGFVVFWNSGGLGAQTRRLVKMIKPEKLLIVDSSPFSKLKDKHPEWYEGYDSIISHGFPSNSDTKEFLKGLTHIFTCENPYNFNLVYWGQRQGTKVYCQTNFEFCENLNKDYLPVPDLFPMPSYWKIEKMKELFGEDSVVYLPPPIDQMEFVNPREHNFNNRQGRRRFLHIVGNLAANDRNGTLDLLKALPLCKSDFELVITSQHPLPPNYQTDDKRVVFDTSHKEKNSDLYVDFDALVLPRRYGGLSLNTNEALLCGLPVIMTDISPNNLWLPKDWLVKSNYVGQFQARSVLDIYSVDHQALAEKIDWLTETDLREHRKIAFELGVREFDFPILKPKYDQLWI